MTIALGKLALSTELLGILILESDGRSDLVDDVLIGSGVVAAGRFIAHQVGGLCVGVHVAAGQPRIGMCQLVP